MYALNGPAVCVMLQPVGWVVVSSQFAPVPVYGEPSPQLLLKLEFYRPAWV